MKRAEYLEQLRESRRKPPAGAPPGAMSLLEFAQRIGVTRVTVYNNMAKGRCQPSGWTKSQRPFWLPADVEAFKATPLARRRELTRRKTIANAMQRCASRIHK